MKGSGGGRYVAGGVVVYELGGANSGEKRKPKWSLHLDLTTDATQATIELLPPEGVTRNAQARTCTHVRAH